MPLVRLILPLGALFLGAVAVFMGAMVLAFALASDEITTTHETAEGRVVTKVERSIDPQGYWTRVGLLGALPVLLGGAAVLWGRRKLAAK